MAIDTTDTKKPARTKKKTTEPIARPTAPRFELTISAEQWSTSTEEARRLVQQHFDRERVYAAGSGYGYYACSDDEDVLRRGATIAGYSGLTALVHDTSTKATAPVAPQDET